MVSRMAASTSGCLSNFPAIRAAARSKAVRTFRSGSGLLFGRAWFAVLAWARRSFCKKSLIAREVAASSVRSRRLPHADDDSGDQHDEYCRNSQDQSLVAPRELLQLVNRARRTGHDRLVMEIMPDISGQVCS